MISTDQSQVMIYYVPFRLVSWDRLCIQSPLGDEILLDTDQISGLGFLPAFETLDELQKEYPDVEYFEIKEPGSND